MQALGAVYHLSQSVELAPSQGGAVKVPVTVGLRGSFDCERCSDAMRVERGFCPFVEGCERATVPTFLGEREEDALWACPRGVALRNPGLWPTLGRFFEVQSATPLGYFGEGLVQLPPRVAATYAALCAVERRFEAEVLSTRSQMDKRGGNA